MLVIVYPAAPSLDSYAEVPDVTGPVTAKRHVPGVVGPSAGEHTRVVRGRDVVRESRRQHPLGAGRSCARGCCRSSRAWRHGGCTPPGRARRRPRPLPARRGPTIGDDPGWQVDCPEAASASFPSCRHELAALPPPVVRWGSGRRRALGPTVSVTPFSSGGLRHPHQRGDGVSGVPLRCGSGVGNGRNASALRSHPSKRSRMPSSTGTVLWDRERRSRPCGTGRFASCSWGPLRPTSAPGCKTSYSVPTPMTSAVRAPSSAS